MEQSLFDQTFYEQFSASARQRLENAARSILSYRKGQVEYAAVVESLRDSLHNIAGEARLLELREVGSLVLRLGQRLERMSGKPREPLSATACNHFVDACELLCTVIFEQIRHNDPSRDKAVEVLLEVLTKLEAS